MTRTRLPADQQAPAVARAFVLQSLSALPPDAATIVDEVVLVVSELVTNSVRARATHIELDLVVRDTRVELVVTDDASGWPTPRTAASGDLGGRGLMIVDQLAGSWSATPIGEHGKSVRATWA